MVGLGRLHRGKMTDSRKGKGRESATVYRQKLLRKYRCQEPQRSLDDEVCRKAEGGAEK